MVDTQNEPKSGHLHTEGFPHNYLQDKLNCKVGSLEVTKGPEAPEDAYQIVKSDRRLSAVAVQEWEEMSIGGSIHVPEEVFSGTLPFEERDEPPVSLVIAVRASQTMLRFGISERELDVDVDGEGDYEFSVELKRDSLRGEVKIKPYLVRGEPQDINEDYATDYGDRLASDEAWTVEIDREQEDGGFLHPRIEPFDHFDSFPNGENLHYLHFEDPSTPKLFLNANHQQLIGVLQSDGAVGHDARFRDVLYDYIEQSVWQELLLRTASDADPDGGELKYPWQEEVVELFEDELFDVEDYEDVVRRLGELASSGEDVDVLAKEIDAAIQKRVDHPTQALKLLQEGIEID
ncbi:hypothetical protein [Halobaculum sp. D14]|uniref:hypothetical protein n=1 Tax=Halobaculum sp. D14 TaxID=3421642 RepID=UPI003EC0A999